MTENDAQRMVADAILFERSARALRRRFGTMGFAPNVASYLENTATGLRDLADRFPLRTKTGKLITEEEIRRWADEAERGYDISNLLREDQ